MVVDDLIRGGGGCVPGVLSPRRLLLFGLLINSYLKDPVNSSCGIRIGLRTALRLSDDQTQRYNECRCPTGPLLPTYGHLIQRLELHLQASLHTLDCW
jgi:hypothetical protein